MGQRKGLERVAEQHKRLHSPCSPKAGAFESFQGEMWQVGAVENGGSGDREEGQEWQSFVWGAHLLTGRK